MSCNWTQTLWTFRTQNFRIEWRVRPCHAVDLSFDDDGSVAEGLESGRLEAFDSEMIVYYWGQEVGADYLGQSIYENVSDFRDHIGMNTRGHGSYFSDMVRGAVAEARKNLADRPRLRKVA
jgi:hypothetical protein